MSRVSICVALISALLGNNRHILLHSDTHFPHNELCMAFSKYLVYTSVHVVDPVRVLRMAHSFPLLCTVSLLSQESLCCLEH